MSTRRVYGHWSGDYYGKVLTGFHRCIAMEVEDLDAMVKKLEEARNRRVGGSLQSYYDQVLELKDDAQVRIYENAALTEDLRYHTPKRGENSLAICMCCGHGATPRSLGYAEPLPDQIQAFVDLVVESCIELNVPIENFMTHSEAADNLDFPAMDDPAAPHEPYGYRTKKEAWDLEFWLEPWTFQLYAPTQSASGAMVRFADYVRQQALTLICESTRPRWQA
jgi:hypothetical protein